MLKALRHVCAGGSLVPWRRSYRTRELAGGSPHGTIVLVACGDCAGRVLFVTPRTNEHVRLTESECSRMGITLRVVAVEEGQERAKAARAIQSAVNAGDRGRDALLGFVFWPIGLVSPRAILEQLESSGLPLAVLDETGDTPAPRSAGNGRTRVFSLGSSRSAGAIAARHLLDKGHRRVAFFSPFHGSDWSRNRLDGLRGTFVDAGLPDAVSAHTLAQRLPCEFLAQAHSTLGVIDNLLSVALRDSGPNREMLKRTVREVDERLKRVLEKESMYEELCRLLDQALSDTTVTAWVGANDVVALGALRYLEKLQISVPGRMSVMGFDDSMEGFFSRLTTVNLNGQAAVRAALAHVLGRFAAEHQSPGGIIEFSGSVVERGTTAPPRAV